MTKHALIALLAISFTATAMAANLEQQFLNPPPSARPHTYWYWIDGNITQEGITADLEAMQRAGIGGVELYNIGGHGTPGAVKVMSPEWRKLMFSGTRQVTGDRSRGLP